MSGRARSASTGLNMVRRSIQTAPGATATVTGTLQTYIPAHSLVAGSVDLPGGTPALTAVAFHRLSGGELRYVLWNVDGSNLAAGDYVINYEVAR